MQVQELILNYIFFLLWQPIQVQSTFINIVTMLLVGVVTKRFQQNQFLISIIIFSIFRHTLMCPALIKKPFNGVASGATAFVRL